MRISFLHNIFLIICFSMLFIPGAQPNDIVVNSTVNSNWTSLMFIIPIDAPRNILSSRCRQQSIYYCLHAFVSDPISSTSKAVQVRFRDHIDPQDPTVVAFKFIKFSASQECRQLLEPVYRDHNLFLFHDGCCLDHYCHYFMFGYGLALLTPKEYYEKLTDYTDEGKVLNFIMAYHSPDCEANVIMELGFGKGEVNTIHSFRGMPPEQPGLPYLLKVGHHWAPKIPYENPRDFITFSWFKKNVICADQPWICYKPEQRFKKANRWWRRFFGKRFRFDKP